MSKPAASLLVPCYNAASHLPRLWETIRAQTTPFQEIICYDDASPDRTSEVARQLGARVIRGEVNHGPAHARNTLWRAAATDWVHFHDADDLLDPRFLEKMSARASQGADVVICNALWQMEDTRKREMEWCYSEASLQAAPVSYLIQNPVGGINGYYRRAALERIGGFNEQLRTWEDADLHVRLAADGARYGVVEESLVIALRHPKSISADGTMRIECRARLLEAYAQSLPAADHPAIAAEAENLAAWLLGENLMPEIAARCLAVCRQLNWAVPSSRHPVLRGLRPILPAAWLLRWQQRFRRQHSA